MAKTKISEFSATPGNNTDIDGINIAEGCAPSGINDAIRELMAQLKDWQAGTSNDPYVVGSSGSLTLSYGTANGVPYLNGSKVLTSGSALTFDGTNLGIGTSSPSNALEVARGASTAAYVSLRGNNNAQAAEMVLGQGASGLGVIYQRANADIAFGTNNTERMRIDSSGNVGIGTSSPSTKFTVNGNANLTGNFYTPDYGYFGNSAGTFSGINTGFQTLSGGSGYLLAFTNGNERMRIDSSGNVGIGTSSPTAKLEVYDASSAVARVTAGTEIFEIRNTGSEVRLAVVSADPMTFRTSNVEAMRIDSSGNLLVNTTAQQTGGNGKLSVAGGSGGAAATLTNNSNASWYTTEIYNYTTSTGAGSGRYVKFAMGSTPTQTGSIIGDGTNTAYNTSSDYRLKENVAPMTGALALVMQQRPVTWTWKTSGKPGKGFIAHWLQEDGAGECVSGEKDAVDADGNPDYQGVDTSFLIATLTAAIQEQQAIITSLTARVTALETN